jgi:2-dehydropantoate 2-reductase
VPTAAERRVELLDGTVVELGHVLTTEASVVSTVDTVILLVKVGDTAAALAAIQPFIYSGQQILTLQNGLGGAQRIHAALGHVPRIFSGVTSQAATRPRPDLVLHAGEGPTIVGPFDPHDLPAASALAHALSDAGLPTAAVPEIDRWVWQKVAVNAAINGLTALGGVHNGAIVADPALLDAAEIVGEETAAVARAHGIELGNVRSAIAETARATAANRSSMLQDIDAGRRTEVDAIHGAIVAAGEATGIATPATQVLASLIRLRERSRA